MKIAGWRRALPTNRRRSSSARTGWRPRRLDVRRYLRLLGFGEDPPDGREGLYELVRRHLCRVPFENVSKLLLLDREGAGRPLVLEEFLDGIEHSDLGGTCHYNNPFLAALLKQLGYDADLLGASMSAPNVHTSVRVRLDGISYHVDVGYAAPFRRPMPLNELPHVIVEGERTYVFDRRAPGEHELAVLRGGEREHGYVVHDTPREHVFFHRTIFDSFLPGRTFVNCLRITRFFEDHTMELRNRTATRCEGNASRTWQLDSVGDLRRVVADEFQMPRCPIDRAIDILERLTCKRFF